MAALESLEANWCYETSIAQTQGKHRQVCKVHFRVNHFHIPQRRIYSFSTHSWKNKRARTSKESSDARLLQASFSRRLIFKTEAPLKQRSE